MTNSIANNLLNIIGPVLDPIDKFVICIRLITRGVKNLRAILRED